MHTEIWDVIIVGGGAAGLSAAQMLGRSRRRVLMLDAGLPRNRNAAHMHGLLGYDGTAPAELLRRGRQEAESYGVVVRPEAAEQVSEVPGGVRLETSSGVEYTARTLVAATGLSDELPGVPGLGERWGHSVLHCPYCHGWEVRDQRLGVLATSPMSVHQVELIRQLSDRTVLFSAGIGELEHEATLRLRSRGITVEPARVVGVTGGGLDLSGVVLEGGREVPLDALFVAATLHPQDGYLKELSLGRTDTPFGSFIAVDVMGKTDHDRVWAAGNVVSPGANVPMAMGAGAAVGAAVNAALVAWDVAGAVQRGS